MLLLSERTRRSLWIKFYTHYYPCWPPIRRVLTHTTYKARPTFLPWMGRNCIWKYWKQRFQKLDSCDVVHGQFTFSGSVDSVRMANIFMDDENVLPVVLENGDITIKIDNTQQMVSGTPLNDKLFKFFNKYNQLKIRKLSLCISMTKLSWMVWTWMWSTHGSMQRRNPLRSSSIVSSRHSWPKFR